MRSVTGSSELITRCDPSSSTRRDASTAGMVIFEIPTGVVANTSGRRRSFLLSAATLALGTLGYLAIAALGGGLVWFVVASVVLGRGFSFYSGAVEVWLVDALGATGYRGQLDRVFARGSMVSGTAMLVGSVGGGVLGDVDLAWPFLVRSLLLAAVFLVGLRAMDDIGFTPRTARLSAMPTQMGRVLTASLEFGWRSRPVRPLMGRKAGTRGPCAVQGLPQVASVDTTARQPAASAP